VTRAFVQFNKSGSSTGVAEVKFSNGKEARAAVQEYNGVILFQTYLWSISNILTVAVFLHCDRLKPTIFNGDL